MSAVVVVDDTANVVFDTVVSDEFKTALNLVERRTTAPRRPVPVVQSGRTVDADADEEFLVGEVPTPLVVQSRPVRLHRVDNTRAGRRVFLLEMDCRPEEVDVEQGRLVALPGERDFRARKHLDVLLDVFLKRLLGHARVSPLRIQVVLSR
ncbi:hypothetical protein [Halocatena marina]|uniref:Uncharacterized protein n=1 Tax=Halocatena marina TaxID=2934937 RepID=A0ABD5YU78_9EURY|nr:hypothetical protein [Halocatena marina]